MAAHPLAAGMRTALLAAFARTTPINLPNPIQIAAADLVAHGKENCTLVALTNLAATATDIDVRPDVLAKQAGGVDFRSLYKSTTRPVILTVAADLNVVSNPSPDPFVSNPFREEKVDAAWVQRRLNKLPGAQDLRVVLEFAAADPTLSADLLALVAVNFRTKLGKYQVSYNLPPRLTTSFVSSLLNDWLDGGNNGSRLEHLAVALLRFAGSHLTNSWNEVESHHVNDPRPYDALCSTKGEVIALAECKDQLVTSDHVLQLAREMAAAGAARGYLFTRLRGLDAADRKAIDATIQSRSVFGFRIDLVEITEATRTWLSLIDQDDKSLPAFMAVLTTEMGEHGNLEDRRDLAALIDQKVATI